MSRINHITPTTEKTFSEWHDDEYGTGEVATPAAVARYLGVDKTTVWRWLDSGDMPGIRTARYWILMTATIDDWITEVLTAQAARA